MREMLVYILPAAVSLFWAVRIFMQKNANRIQLFIVAGMIAAILTMFFKGAFALFMFPWFYLAVRQKTSAGGIVKWDSLVFLPSVLLSPYSGTAAFTVFLGIQIVSISVWASVTVIRYNRSLAELYDASSDIAEDNIGQALTFIILTVIATVTVVVLPDSIMSSAGMQVVLAAFISVLQYNVGHYTFVIRDNASVTEEIVSIQKEEAARVESGTDNSLLQRVEDEKYFLDPLLSLVSLAEKLETNRTYLSGSIHACRGQNFSEFINTLRIKHFLEIARKEGAGVNIKEAAMNSGYNNLQSFYRNFSEIMQMTPKSWISHNLIEK